MQQEDNRTDPGEILLSTRTLYLYGEITDETALRFAQELHFLEFGSRDPVVVFLNSPGGNEDSGTSIYDLMRLSPVFITCKVVGTASSIAAAILQGADLRLISQNSTFMIHQGSLDVGGAMPQSSFSGIAKQIEKGNERYYRILERSGQELEQINAWCARETFFSAEETVALGFADEILMPLKFFPKKYHKKRKPRK